MYLHCLLVRITQERDNCLEFTYVQSAWLNTFIEIGKGVFRGYNILKGSVHLRI